MGKTIFRKVAGELAELGKDVVKTGKEEATIMIKEGVKMVVGLPDLPSVSSERLQEEARRERRTKAVGIPDQRRILEMAAQEQADMQRQQQDKIRAAQQGQRSIARHELPSPQIPVSGKQGLGKKKSTTTLSPMQKSSAEFKHAGQD